METPNKVLNQTLMMDQIIWTAFLITGTMLGLIFPVIQFEGQIQAILLSVALPLVLFSLFIVRLAERRIERMRLTRTNPDFLAQYRGNMFLALLMSVCLTEAALTLSLEALSGYGRYAKIGLLVAFGAVMALHFPSRAKVQASMERCATGKEDPERPEMA